MGAPRWAAWLLRRLAPEDRADDLIGDLEEAHLERRQRRGSVVAALLTSLDALDVARALLWARIQDAQARISWIDLRLGVRMLAKHPGTTIVGVVAIAFGIAFGAVVFQMMSDLYRPALGFAEGRRVVELEQVAWRAGSEQPRVLHDFLTWREELESVDDVSAYRTVRRNLASESGPTGPVVVAQMSPSGFRVAGVPPLLGRILVDADDEPGSPPVVVVGYDVWQARLGGDDDVVGRTVRLGGVPTTVVGVMPDGFSFPIAHAAWAPLRLNPLDYARGEGPPLEVFGRLAPGAALGQAQAELEAHGARAAAEFPDTNAGMTMFVRPYRGGILNGPEWAFQGAYPVMVLFPLLVLALVCANIALMVFARTAAREGEIVVRSALGASRARIVAQLFVEALVLASVGAAVGLFAADRALGHVMELMSYEARDQLPYWFHRGLTGATVLYGGIFTAIGAAIVGVVPALRVTGANLRGRLQSATAGGGGLRMGRLWSAVIVLQVAVTVALVPWVVAPPFVAPVSFSENTGLPAEEYLTASLGTDLESASATEEDQQSVATERLGDAPRGADALAFHASYTELAERLAAEGAVRGVAVASQSPGSARLGRWMELDTRERRHFASVASVDPDYFDVVGARIVAGRGFETSDLDAAEQPVIVNEAFVRTALERPGAVGQRLRYPTAFRGGGIVPADESPWYRIVGVVSDVETQTGWSGSIGGEEPVNVYHLLAPGQVYPLSMTIHTAGDPAALIPTVRTIAAEVDPSLRLTGLLPLDESVRTATRPLRSLVLALIVTGALALLLSNAGIYSAMSFAVARRTREIGVRVALGADRLRVVTDVLGRSLLQVVWGVLAGGLILFALLFFLSEFRLWAQIAESGYTTEIVLGSVAYLLLMLGICAVSSVVPTRRALAVEPTEALRAEG